MLQCYPWGRGWEKEDSRGRTCCPWQMATRTSKEPVVNKPRKLDKEDMCATCYRQSRTGRKHDNGKMSLCGTIGIPLILSRWRWNTWTKYLPTALARTIKTVASDFLFWRWTKEREKSKNAHARDLEETRPGFCDVIYLNFLRDQQTRAGR